MTKMKWARLATPQHILKPIPLLPSGPGGVFDPILQGHQSDHGDIITELLPIVSLFDVKNETYLQLSIYY